jgi:hypothetical protein
MKTGNVSQKSSEHRIKLSACIVSDLDLLQQDRFRNTTPSTIPLEHAAASLSLLSCSRKREPPRSTLQMKPTICPRPMFLNGTKHLCCNSSPLSSHLFSNLLAIYRYMLSHRGRQSDEAIVPPRRVKSIRIIFAIAGAKNLCSQLEYGLAHHRSS